MDEQTRISNQLYEQTQTAEFVWWQNNRINVPVLWGKYLEVFEPFLRPFETLADIGSGPIPIFCAPGVEASTRIAVDPLFQRYSDLEYYVQFCQGPITWAGQIDGIGSESCDGVFCLNSLDHCQDPAQMLVELQRILKPGGRLYLFVDVEKPPDAMHPHSISEEWLKEGLKHLATRLWLRKKSWKFPTDVVYYVGDRLGEPK